jgi:hypothetical protein
MVTAETLTVLFSSKLWRYIVVIKLSVRTSVNIVLCSPRGSIRIAADYPSTDRAGASSRSRAPPAQTQMFQWK